MSKWLWLMIKRMILLAKEADKMRKQIYAVGKNAATFHYEVQDLVDMEEITE